MRSRAQRALAGRFRAVAFLLAFAPATRSARAELAPHTDLDQALTEEDGAVVVEAESLRHSDSWTLVTEPEGFTGEGYLRWSGRSQGVGNTTDQAGQYQGDPKDWLVVTVIVSDPGEYVVDVLNLHKKHDGDNDIWVHKVGKPPPVQRSGDNEQGRFTWLDWGTHSFHLDAGLNQVYVAGRSPGFGVDRIAVFKRAKSAKARDRSTPESMMDSVLCRVKVELLEDVAAMLARKQLGAAWERAGRCLADEDPARAAEAARVREAIPEYVARRREYVASLKARDPAMAVDRLLELASKLNGSAFGKELREEARRWEGEPATRKERAARRLSGMVEGLVEKLDRQLRGKRITDPGIGSRATRLIRTIARNMTAFRQFPDTTSYRKLSERLVGLGFEETHWGM